MKFKKCVFMFLLIIMLTLTFSFNIIHAKVLWMDNFDDNKINPQYQFVDHPGKWVAEDGVLKQTEPAPGDHTYCIIDGGFPEPHTVIVKVRIDDWGDNDLSRAGIGVRINPAPGQGGYVFLIHHTLNNMEFLNDHLAWKNNDTPPPFGAVEIGKWYWMKAEISDKLFTGKIWPEDEKEPAKWLLESGLDFGAVRPASGIVGLNGGSNTGGGKTLVSFDDFAVLESADEAIPEVFNLAVGTNGKITNTWGNIKSEN